MLDIDKKKYIEEVKAMHNHICIIGDTEIVRCIGFFEDAFDYYYTCSDIKGNITQYTFVGPCVSLKDIYTRYDILENIFKLNGSLPVDEFIHKIASDEDNWKLYKIKTVNGIEDEEWMDKYRELTNQLDWSIN